MRETLFSDQSYDGTTFNQLLLEPETAVSTSQFSDCTFTDCTFSETAFHACRFVGCTFEQCDLSLTTINKTSFVGCKFDGCQLIGINWSAGDWPSRRLHQPLHFTACNLSHATFIGLKLHGVRFENGRLHDVDFREADLTRASFDGCDLEKSRFQQTNLSHTDLRRARNYSINPSLNQLTKAKFALPEAIALLYNLDITLEESE